MRLYPSVEEFAILSDMPASLYDCAAKPDTPAFSEEIIVINAAFLDVDAFIYGINMTEGC